MLSSMLAIGLNVLVIGESHMSLPRHLLDPLHDDLSAQGATVHSIGACGASAGDWLVQKKVDCGAERIGSGAVAYKGPQATTTPIGQLIRQDKPDLVIVVIGDTMASYDSPNFPKAWVWQGVSSLVKGISATGTPCAWVGPAWGKAGGKYKKNDARTQVMSSFLASNVAPCVYIDSLKMSKPGQWTTTDGQHFTLAGYTAWAKGITGEVVKLPAFGKGAKGK